MIFPILENNCLASHTEKYRKHITEKAYDKMNDKILEWAMKIQSISQIGLAYCKDPFDRERYEDLREISAEMLAERTGISEEKAREVFLCEEGYQTPKVDTRAAIFRDGKILMVHEKNGTWSLPGGWCDVDRSIATNTVKEVKEETGLDATAEKLIAIQDWRLHNVRNYVYGVLKAFVLCSVAGGAFEENIETVGIEYFARDELPERLAVEKTTREQILMCFDANENRSKETLFD